MTRSPYTPGDVMRSILYHMCFIAVTLAMGVFFLPLLLNRKHSALGSTIPYKWTGCALWLQKHVLRLRYTLRSDEALPQGNAVYAIKHQSAWETIALWHILKHPVFVLKKELVDIPVFGWYLAQADNIVIDRNAKQKATAQIIEQSREYLSQQRNIVIFPEGTRTAPGKATRYKTGVAALYDAVGESSPIYPVALNSGCFWPKNGFIRKAGTIEIEIMGPMTTGLEKQQFMQQLQTNIETATARLVESPKFLTKR